MSRRLMLRNASGGGKVLPPEYQQVEYIESAGNASVTFPVETGHSYLKFTGAFYIPSKPSAEQMILRAQDAQSLELGVARTNGRVFVYANGKSTGFTNSNIYGKNCDFDFVLDENSSTKRSFNLTLDGVTYTSNENTTQSVSPSSINLIYIFGPSGYLFKGRITKPLSIATQNNTVILNAVPCYEKQTGNIGFYDTVSDTFKFNANFSKGADVN